MATYILGDLAFWPFSAVQLNTSRVGTLPHGVRSRLMVLENVPHYMEKKKKKFAITMAKQSRRFVENEVQQKKVSPGIPLAQERSFINALVLYGVKNVEINTYTCDSSILWV